MKEVRRRLRSWSSLLLNIPLFNWPLPPLSYRPVMQGVMAVGIEPRPMAEVRRLRELRFSHDLEVVEEPTVRFLLLHRDIGERHSPFVFRHLRIEAIDTAGLAISGWPAS